MVGDQALSSHRLVKLLFFVLFIVFQSPFTVVCHGECALPGS